MGKSTAPVKLTLPTPILTIHKSRRRQYHVDPMFIGIDDLRLQAGSPAIDAGIDEPYELSGLPTE